MSLHDQVIRLDQSDRTQTAQFQQQIAQVNAAICRAQRADRTIDTQIARAAHITVVFPSIGPESCP